APTTRRKRPCCRSMSRSRKRATADDRPRRHRLLEPAMAGSTRGTADPVVAAAHHATGAAPGAVPCHPPAADDQTQGRDAGADAAVAPATAPADRGVDHPGAGA